ncbi:carbamoyltransferase family protein [Streptomyces varsoviensis]|nr:carbamoyltransferase C-terminal domain-containing protein [Streptomyces varsoviensis]
MYILGVNTGPHDSSACLLKDGELIVMVEQERLSRRKRAFGEAPRAAVAACLRAADISLGDVAETAVGWDVPLLSEVEGAPFDAARFHEWLLPDGGGERRPPTRFVPHHMAHAASALWTSGFEDAAILVLDGRGECRSTTLARGSAGKIEVIRDWDTSLSLGNFYSIAAQWAGFTMWDAGKLMGLASYGRPDQAVPLIAAEDDYTFPGAPAPRRRPAQHYLQLHDFLYEYFGRNNYPYAQGDRNEPMAHASFAASVQAALEDVLLELARFARRRTGADRLVLAGGVALNCAANGRLARSGIFSDIYVPPVPHDAGVGLGAALLADRELSGRGDGGPAHRMRHAYWGPGITAEDIASALHGAGLATMHLSTEDVIGRTAAHLAAGRLVAWCAGRGEVGQRALGARSILCDPRHRSAVARLNSVKGREIWRPLAPSVLEEYWSAVFEAAPLSLCEFMLAAVPVRASARRMLAAAVHVDGTARPHVVRRSVNERFWTLIDAFRRLTGVPAVLNTSFNLAGEPVVFGPDDAIATFVRSDIEVLVLGDCLLEKPSVSEPVRDQGGRRAARPARGTGVARGTLDSGMPFLPWQSAAPSEEEPDVQR